MPYIVMLEVSRNELSQVLLRVWLATWAGDPGRTYTRACARRYATQRGARIALGMARRFRPFPNARIVEVRS